MSDVAIRVEAVSKKYRIEGRKYRHDTLRDHIMEVLIPRRGGNGRPPEDEKILWALKNVSFEVKEGQVVGIIGRNGAGKSTLLKTLSCITTPTSGAIEIRGRVGSLLEVGTGFHPELTGRENIFLNGAILGMKKAQIDRKFDEIIDFSGVQKFIDTPVKRYSSGMYVRLAFAVAAHLDSEILIIDEALAVGDSEFQKKCLARIEKVAKDGRTTLLVSHNMSFITTLAEQAIVLEKGENKFFGPVERAVAVYLGQGPKKRGVQILRENCDRPSGMTPALIACQITDSECRTKSVFNSGEEFRLEVEYSTEDNVRLAGAAMRISTLTGTLVGRLNTFMYSRPPHRIPSKGKLAFRLSELVLCPGDYSVTLVLITDRDQPYDCVFNAVEFSVEQTEHPNGSGYLLTNSDGLCTFRGGYEIEALEQKPCLSCSKVAAY